MCRAGDLSSLAVSRVEEEKHEVEALQKNGCPKGVIHKQTCLHVDRASQQDRETCATLTLPYIIVVCQSQSGGSLAHFPPRYHSPLSRPLKQVLVHPKDPVPVSRKKGVIYSIPCAECPRTYIGQTGKSLDLHLQEHRRALKKEDVTTSAVAEHVFEADHQVDLSKASVIDYHPHIQTCCLLESWHIREKGPKPGLRLILHVVFIPTNVTSCMHLDE